MCKAKSSHWHYFNQRNNFRKAKFWAVIVDDYTDCCSFVMKNKSDLKGKIKTLLTDSKIARVNSGENMIMKNHPEIK
jgi:hypothetical protein